MEQKKNTFDKFDKEKTFKSLIGPPTTQPVQTERAGQTETNEIQQDISVSVDDSTSKTAGSAYKQSGRKKLTSREKKKRYSFTIFPSVYENAQKKSIEEGRPLSELVSEFLKKYAK